jgi:hypothetical protein
MKTRRKMEEIENLAMQAKIIHPGPIAGAAKTLGGDHSR